MLNYYPATNTIFIGGCKGKAVGAFHAVLIAVTLLSDKGCCKGNPVAIRNVVSRAGSMDYFSIPVLMTEAEESCEPVE